MQQSPTALQIQEADYGRQVIENPDDPAIQFGYAYPQIAVFKTKPIIGYTDGLIHAGDALAVALVHAPHAYEVGRFMLLCHELDTHQTNRLNRDPIEDLGFSLLKAQPGDTVVRFNLADHLSHNGKDALALQVLKGIPAVKKEDRYYMELLASIYYYGSHSHPEYRPLGIAEYQQLLQWKAPGESQPRAKPGSFAYQFYTENIKSLQSGQQ